MSNLDSSGGRWTETFENSWFFFLSRLSFCWVAKPRGETNLILVKDLSMFSTDGPVANNYYVSDLLRIISIVGLVRFTYQTYLRRSLNVCSQFTGNSVVSSWTIIIENKQSIPVSKLLLSAVTSISILVYWT